MQRPLPHRLKWPQRPVHHAQEARVAVEETATVAEAVRRVVEARAMNAAANLHKR